MAPWVPQNASSGCCEELGIAMSAPPRASSRSTARNTTQGSADNVTVDVI